MQQNFIPQIHCYVICEMTWKKVSEDILSEMVQHLIIDIWATNGLQWVTLESNHTIHKKEFWNSPEKWKLKCVLMFQDLKKRVVI